MLLTLTIIKMKFRFILLTLFIIFNLSTISKGETQADSSENFSSLMLNVSFTNNNLEYLTGVTEKIPTLFSNISYFHKSGLYAGFGYSNYFSDSVQSNEYNIEAGFQKYFDNGFDFDISYGWHKYDGDTILQGIDYDHSLSFMMGQDIEKFYISSSLLYTNGVTNNYFLDIGISRSIQFDQVFSKNDVLMINPTLSLSFGTDNWLYESMTSDEKTLALASLKSAGYNGESLGYEGFDIFIPISYGINNIYLTASWLYKIPGAKYEFLGWENQSGFMFSLTYFLNFSK